MNTESLLYVVLFLSVLLLIEGLYMILRDARGRGENVNRRLRLIAGRLDGRDVLATLRRERQDALSSAVAKALPWLEASVARAGLAVPLARVVIGMVALGVASFLAVRLLLPMPLLVALMVGGVTGFALPLLLLTHLAKRRVAAFGRQLPDSLDLIVRSLRAGHPVSAAVDLVAKEMRDPLGSEFGLLIDEMTYGMSLPEALESMGRRMPHPDLRYLIVTIQIQHQSGGNLAEVLSNLSRVIRERFAMFAKVRAVSAEGRLSGLIVSLMPFAVVGYVSLTSPGYFGAVKHDPLFVPLFAAAGVLLLIGHIAIWRLVRLRF